MALTQKSHTIYSCLPIKEKPYKGKYYRIKMVFFIASWPNELSMQTSHKSEASDDLIVSPF